jgi:CheY-like chemotaxis protein
MSQILIVDDEPGIRALVSAALRAAGHHVETTGDPFEAIEWCRTSRFDLVVSDVVMPDIDGHELARRIAPLCPRTRVALMSGLDPGCDNCPYIPRCPLIHKPFDVRHVAKWVFDILAAVRPPGEKDSPLS